MNGNNFFIIDVGNTDIVIALIKDFQIYKIKRYKTIDFRNKKLLLFKKFTQIKKILSKQNKINCIISSVVPEINYNLKKKITINDFKKATKDEIVDIFCEKKFN